MNENVDPAAMREVRPARVSPAPPKSRRRGRLVKALALAALALLAFERWERLAPGDLGLKKPDARSGLSPQTIRAAAAELGPMPITLDALGTVTPLATVTIRAQVSGRLMSVGFEEGQMVKAGDFLAQIDPRPFEAALSQAQGQLAKDNSLLQQAQANLSRYETLNRQDSIARQQVDDQAYLVAQYKAALIADQAQIDTAKLNLGYARIASPINGRVGLRIVDPGNYVQPSDANGLVVITQLDPISVVFSIPEDNLPRIVARTRAGAVLPVTANDRSNVRALAKGELSTFDNQIDTSTGTLKLRANFANPENALFPNQFVNVRLLVDTLEGVVLAPNAAVQLGQDGPFVYVVKDGKTVEARKVTVGVSDGARTVIATGLKAGESVVVDGVDRLRDGAEIRLAAAKPEASAEGAEKPAGEAKRKRKKDGGAP